MEKLISLEKAAKKVKEGDTLGISGFAGPGEPLMLLEALIEEGTQNLTTVSVVTSFPAKELGIGRLAENKQISNMIAAHIGTSKAVQKQYNAGEINVELNPMGTLVERLHAGGAGLGGVLTPTGVGTQLEETVEKVTRNGKEYLLYDPLTVDIAFIKANKADKNGNLFIEGTSKTISPQLALAADLVIAEVDEIVEVGEIDPELITVSEILVNYIVKGQTIEERKDQFETLWGEAGQLRKE